MNTDIEDYIKNKNAMGADDYNNFDETKYDIDKCKNVLKNMLVWIYNNTNLIVDKQIGNKQFKRLFNIALNKQMNMTKIRNMRKSVLLTILNNYCCDDDFVGLGVGDNVSLDIGLGLNVGYNLKKYIELMKYLLIKKPSRSESGVAVITVLTAPFPNGQTFSCKHNCYYCPNEPAHEDNNWQAQPRSYLFREPAVLRANQHKFSAIGQMLNRLDTYRSNGHISSKTLLPDKIEIIIEGGTFTEYPADYLEDYLRDLFYAANILGELYATYPNYNNVLHKGLELDLEFLNKVRQPLSIREEIVINKTTAIHIIGICIETRPDALNDEWLWRFRLWGITRVQIGIQHVDNRILKKINRGHTIEQGLWAMQYLKDNCFKIDIHIMPDLPGATPEIDKAMFDYVYSTVCPDQTKVYPCEVVPWTIIEKWYKSGEYVPYFETNPQDLIDVVKYSMSTCSPWIRLPRVVRDIPLSYIECGNTVANLRQVIDLELDNEGFTSPDIRFREIARERNEKYYDLPASYNIYKYCANGGTDYFIAYESFDRNAIFGFIRLRIVAKNGMNIFDVLNNRGLIRELHVYGNTSGVGVYGIRGCQHNGIGSELLRIAERKIMECGLYGIGVISGEGVKGYYEKKGYLEKDTFMVKDFWWGFVWFYIAKCYMLDIYNYLVDCCKV
jgi:ELP3 family radical SAM enzyme/protein acetyltransferase